MDIAVLLFFLTLSWPPKGEIISYVENQNSSWTSIFFFLHTRGVSMLLRLTSHRKTSTRT